MLCYDYAGYGNELQARRREAVGQRHICRHTWHAISGSSKKASSLRISCCMGRVSALGQQCIWLPTLLALLESSCTALSPQVHGLAAGADDYAS